MTQHTHVAPAWQHIAQSANDVVEAARLRKTTFDQAKAEACRRQRDTLLSLIKTAPIVKDMSLPLPILKLAEGISPEVEREVFIDTVKLVADGKDLLTAHWAFLASELRALPDNLPKRTQVAIDGIIVGMDRLAVDRIWRGANATLNVAVAADAADADADAVAKASADAAFYAAAYARFDIKAVAYATTKAAACAADAAAYAAVDTTIVKHDLTARPAEDKS